MLSAVVSIVAGITGCSVTITKQMSSHPCDGHFGCFSNNTMWVEDGCRGVFTCNGVTNVLCDPCDPGPCGGSIAVCPCSPPSPPPPAPKYLLLDDRNVIDTTATLVLGDVEKHGAPLLREEREYEMRFDNMQPNVWYDPELSKWRVWYSAFTSCSKPKETVPYCNNAPQTCGTPTEASHADRGTGFLYAESVDGLVWTKPNLNLTEWNGSKDNNIIDIGGMTTGVYLDESAPKAERYKMQPGSNGGGGVAVSSDGLTWNFTKDLSKDTRARWDTPKNIVWDAVREQWIMYIRVTPTTPQIEGGSIRIQSYTHSLTADYMGEWADAIPTGLNSSSHYQPDGLVVWPYAGIYLGIGNVFNPFQEAGPQAAIGQVNMVLGWSADGRQWKWIKPDSSFVPLGSSGAFDSCGVFGAKQDPLRTAENDTMRLYYAGCNGPFFGSRGCALGMATMQRDGWAGYRGGTVVTAPVSVIGNSLRISVQGGTQGVRVGVVGSPTLTIDACDPIVGQRTDAIVTWAGKSDLDMQYGAITLEFSIPSDATLFAYSL
eukprot:m.18167 g.18167  ORF g.18167 m.18167 type:complete len:543 (+) comp5277_c0_seq1:92-1720(+)